MGTEAGTMSVIHAVGTNFAGGGFGNRAYHAVRGLYQHGMLQRLLCGAYRVTDIPPDLIRSIGLPDRVLRKLATYDRRYWLWYIQHIIFDIWASQQLEPANLLHVWSSHGLRTIRKAKKMGMLAIVECPATHPCYHRRLLTEEYARWGLHWTVPDEDVTRMVSEFALADLVVTRSDFARQTFINEGVKPTKVIHYPSGVNLTQFQPAWNRNPTPFRVLFVGQIGLRKGVPYLLEAWQQLGWQDAELWLAGRIMLSMRSLLSRYSHLPGITYPGHIPDPAALYQSADIFVLPSLEEGSALVTYEALASGLPVVTTPNAGSVVRNDQEGIIVPVRDVAALATALETLRTNTAQRQEMGRAARRRAEAFSWEAYGQETATRFARIIAERDA